LRGGLKVPTPQRGWEEEGWEGQIGSEGRGLGTEGIRVKQQGSTSLTTATGVKREKGGTVRKTGLTKGRSTKAKSPIPENLTLRVFLEVRGARCGEELG